MDLRLFTRALLLIALCALTLVGCGGNGSGGGSGGTGTPLTVSSTSPTPGANGASLSTRIAATFSAPVDATTLSSASFQASSPAGALVGTVSGSGNTATLLLNTALPPNTVITATITNAVKDMVGNGIGSNYVWSFTTGATIDTTPPTVSSTDPAQGTTGVPLNKTITTVFSKSIRADTLTSTTFGVSGPGGAVQGFVSLLNNVATFHPTTNFAAGTLYTVTITTGVKDLSDNALAANKVWTFTTGTTTTTTTPSVTLTDPGANEASVSTNKTVSATFSASMDASTINSGTFVLKTSGGSVVPATLSYSGKVAALNPISALAANTVYVATISIAVKDTAGNPLAKDQVWSFTTGASADTTKPTVLSTNPADMATNVFRNASVNATFSKAMQASTLNTATFSVAGVDGTVSYDTASHIATFKPTADLASNTTYTARIEVGAKDSAGNALAAPQIWSFTTGAQRSQTNIDLGAASTYAVLAGSTVTNGGPTIINGDLGVSPGTAVTGFPPGIVNGAMHAGDAAAAQAKTALLAAQLDAAGRLGALTLPGDLSGLTFTPGLYKNSTSVMLSAGNVTLDAGGDVNAVFIFQMGSTLTTSTGTHVILAGGAQAKNIYWSVGSSATLGVNSVFKGVILSEVSITVNTGVVLDGTLLTKTGAVSLLSNQVTRASLVKP